MNSKKILMLMAALLAATTVLLVARQLLREGRQTEEQQLLALVDRLAAAAEQRKIKELRQHVSRAYLDPSDRDYKRINQYLIAIYIRQGKFSAYVLNKDVTVDHEARPLTARMRVKVVLTRGPRVAKLTDIVPDAARALVFKLKWHKVGDDWRLTSADWDNLRDVKELLR